jgi:hypothetical protein
MRLTRIVSVALAIFLFGGLTAELSAQDQTLTQSAVPSSYELNRFNLTSPTALPTPSGGFTNPAVYGMLNDFTGQISWRNNDDRINTSDSWGFFTGAGERIGFGIIESEVPLEDGTTDKVQDMRIALVDHHWRTNVALAYGWSRGADEAVGRSEVLQVGMTHMIGRWAAVGAVGNFALDSPDRSGFFEVSMRPVGKSLTFFADAELPRGISASDAPWSAGVLFKGIPGVNVSSRYYSDESYYLSVGFKFYGLWLTGSPEYQRNDGRTATTYDVRF